MSATRRSRSTTLASPAVPGSPGLRYITGNNPADTSAPVDLDAHVGDFVSHLATRFGSAANNGVRYYNLDNEPMLWNSTHRECDPAPPGYDEVWAKGLAAATEIKSRDSGAEILGPETWGWCDFWTSAQAAWSPWATASTAPTATPTAICHGPRWDMQQSCANRFPPDIRPPEAAVDWLDIHFYPQGDGVTGLSGNQSVEDDEETVAARVCVRSRSFTIPPGNRNPGSPTRKAQGGPADSADARLAVRLSPGDAACPGRYKWRARQHALRALAQAEALAIFGREGLDMALRWVAPETGSLAEKAGDPSRSRELRRRRRPQGGAAIPCGRAVCSLTRARRRQLAAVRSPSGRLFVLLFNKDTVSRDITVTVNGGVTRNIHLWRLDNTWLRRRRHADEHGHGLHRHPARPHGDPGACAAPGAALSEDPLGLASRPATLQGGGSGRLTPPCTCSPASGPIPDRSSASSRRTAKDTRRSSFSRRSIRKLSKGFPSRRISN